MGGVLLPDSAKEKPIGGEVVSVGPGKREKDGKRKAPQVTLLPCHPMVHHPKRNLILHVKAHVISFLTTNTSKQFLCSYRLSLATMCCTSSGQAIPWRHQAGSSMWWCTSQTSCARSNKCKPLQTAPLCGCSIMDRCSTSNAWYGQKPR